MMHIKSSLVALFSVTSKDSNIAKYIFSHINMSGYLQQLSMGCMMWIFNKFRFLVTVESTIHHKYIYNAQISSEPQMRVAAITD